MALPKGLRELLWERCKGYCEKCGYSLDQDTADFHHRKLRSQGGQDTAENGILVHHRCHIQHKDSIHDNPKKSVEMGYTVPSWGDPSVCRLTLPSGLSVTLTAEGKYEQKAEINERNSDNGYW